MNVLSMITRGAAAAAVILAATSVSAQSCPDWQLNGALIATDAGTAWSPQSYQTTAGGPLNLAQCATVPGHGYMNAAPSFTLTYDAQNRGLDLDFRVEAPCDTLMLINDASAGWHFNDDADGTLNPRIRLSAAPSGVYDIWVGTYSPTSCQATLIVESFPAAGGGTAPAPTPTPPATAQTCPDWSIGGAEMQLNVGGTETRDVVAGGAVNLFQQAGACGIQGHGYVHTGPDFTLYYTAPDGGAELQIAATGECDTLLLVNDQNAQWHFNDDHVGLDPMISIPAAGTGRYDIWVGTYGPDLCRASMTVTSIAPAAPAAPGLSK